MNREGYSIIYKRVSFFLVQASEVNRNKLAHTRLLHGNPVNNIHGAHGLLVMCYNNELALLAELADHLRELTYVGIIERCIHLIEDTERCRFNKVDRKQQRCCC